jgi:hypothetical protein
MPKVGTLVRLGDVAIEMFFNAKQTTEEKPS